MMDESLQNKLKALLAMAEHPNSNPNEAAMAMERANKILLEHNLTRSQIKDTDNGDIAPAGIGVIDRTETNGYTWKRLLLHYLANANLCSIVVSPSANQIHLFGTYDNVKSVLQMFDWIVIQLIPMALKAHTDYVNEGGQETTRKFNAGFYYGAVKTIGERVKTTFNEFKQGTGQALVIYNDKALSTAVSKVYPRLGHTANRISGGYDGMAAGKIAGQNISFGESRKLSNRLSLSGGY